LHIGEDTAHKTTALSMAMDGFKYRCVVDGRKATTGLRDTLYSNDPWIIGDAILSVNPIQRSYPSIVRTPNDTLCEGENATFKLSFVNTPSSKCKIDWKVDTSILASGQDLIFTTPVYRGTNIQALVYTAFRCPASDPEVSNILVTAAHKHPVVNAGKHTTIHYNTTGLLHGKLVAVNQDTLANDTMRYSWAPLSGIKGVSDSLEAKTGIIKANVEYVLSGTNIHGCTTRDTVLVTCKGGPLGMDGQIGAGTVVKQYLEICENDSLCISGKPVGGSEMYHHVWTMKPVDSTPANPYFATVDTSVLCMKNSPVGTTVYTLIVDDGVDTVYKEITVKV
ncbi:MAG: hypothetical protein K2I83_01915, partial [Bacteroidales bacterium]|nr:hypothetical protein [Bacteroidales bacterium]